MKRLAFVAVVVLVAIVAAAIASENAAAGGPGTVVFNSNKFGWHVEWSQPYGSDYETRWSLRSIFTETVELTSVAPLTYTATSSRQIGPDAWFMAIGGRLTDTIGFPQTFSFKVQGADTPVAETNWYRESCASGPEYFASISEFPTSNDSSIQLVVHNTTGKMLYLLVPPSMTLRKTLGMPDEKPVMVVKDKTLGGPGDLSLVRILADDWVTVEQRVSVSSRDGYISLITSMSDLNSVCSTFAWYFPEMINLDLHTWAVNTYANSDSCGACHCHFEQWLEQRCRVGWERAEACPRRSDGAVRDRTWTDPDQPMGRRSMGVSPPQFPGERFPDRAWTRLLCAC